MAAAAAAASYNGAVNRQIGFANMRMFQARVGHVT